MRRRSFFGALSAVLAMPVAAMLPKAEAGVFDAGTLLPTGTMMLTKAKGMPPRLSKFNGADWEEILEQRAIEKSRYDTLFPGDRGPEESYTVDIKPEDMTIFGWRAGDPLPLDVHFAFAHEAIEKGAFIKAAMQRGYWVGIEVDPVGITDRCMAFEGSA